MGLINFDAASAATRTRTSTPLPPGVYTAEITSSDVKALKSGRGTGLALEFTIIDPEEHANRRVWTNLNIKHENQTAEEIGLGQLKELCDALGISRLEDSDDLFGRLVRITTKITPAKGDYPARADVIAYASAGAGAPPAPAAHQPAPMPSAPAAGAAKPWARKAA